MTGTSKQVVRQIGVTVVLAAALATAAAVAAAAVALPVPERVSFDSLDRDAAGLPVRISALLYRPRGPVPASGFPAIIALHGCGGMYGARADGRDVLSRHNVAWTADLLDDGYAVLFPDSFNPRGQREVCTTTPALRSIHPRTRRQDALGALAWLAAVRGIDRERIALLGFSHGGSTTLATITIDGNRTELTLRHFGYGEGPDWAKTRAYFERAWPAVIGNLEKKYASR